MSQIATKIREKSVNLIFAVTEEQLNIYNKLSKYIEGSEATKLANDSSNIVQVIKNNYQVQFYICRQQKCTSHFFILMYLYVVS